MRKLLTVLPIPISGLMLGTTALSKLFFHLQYRAIGDIFFIISLVILCLLSVKIIALPKHFKNGLQNPVVASIMPTFAMSILLMSSNLKLLGYSKSVANVIWIIAAILQISIVLYYVYRHMIKAKLSMQSVIPSWFVTFVGLAMIVVTAPEFAYNITSDLFFVTSLCFLILFPFIIKRIFVLRDLPNPIKPLIAILAAPLSLTLVAYISHFHNVNQSVAIAMFILAQMLYFIVLYEVQTLVKLPFFPSFGALTFPLVVSALGTLLITNLLKEVPQWMDILLYFETIIATAVVLFVLTKYVLFLRQEIKSVEA